MVCTQHQANAVVLRPTSSIAVLHSPPRQFFRSSLPPAAAAAATQDRARTRPRDNDRQTAVTRGRAALSGRKRSPVEEADDRALFESSQLLRAVTDDGHVTTSSSQSLDGQLGRRRRRRSEESEFDNVDALDVDDDRLARVRTRTNIRQVLPLHAV